MSVYYIPRLTAPSDTDLNWIKTTYGGYNYCVIGAPESETQITGSVLANCTGYAWGRWRELLGKYHNLSRGNATNWYGNTGDGYTRGSTVKIFAIACWSGGTDGYGHVAVVEKINSNGTVVVSDSAYTTKPPYQRFRVVTYPANMYKSGYTFQGFIYFPEDIIYNVPVSSRPKSNFKWVLYARKIRERNQN